jgi:biotin/methionine sulfoxide reductase
LEKPILAARRINSLVQKCCKSRDQRLTCSSLVTDAVCPGVLRLSCGAWYDPHDDGNGEPVCAHGNPNVLTRDRGTSRLGQGPSSATVLVEIERATAPAPPVRAFTPPQTVAAATSP